MTNNSGGLQSFIVGNDIGTKQATLTFTGAANAGNLTSYTNYGFAGIISFEDESSAGTATLINTFPDPADQGGVIKFLGNSTADHASFLNNGNGINLLAGQIYFFDNSTAGFGTFLNSAGMPGGNGGQTEFFDSATADHGTFTCQGAQVAGSGGGFVQFYANSTAASATFLVEGGAVNGVNGGAVGFEAGSDTGDATFTVNGGAASGAAGGSLTCLGATGNGNFVVNGATVSGALGAIFYASGLDNATITVNASANGGGAAQIQSAGPTIGAQINLLGDGALFVRDLALSVGSIEGDGTVAIGRNNLSIGSNNLNTTFSGIVTGGETGRGGILTKIGTGTLTLTGANTYSGGTVVESGILLANNTSGSGTGTNIIRVNGGTFGGGGKVSGKVIVGTGSGTGAILGPGARGLMPGTLTIKSKLTLMSDATYKCTLDSSTPAADQVRVKGISIQGAQVLFDDRSSTVLATGTIFTVVSNTARTPIAGTFANLPDGGTITIGSNTYQISYKGGDGNDLTLTVIP